jgi:hypothetical protein
VSGEDRIDKQWIINRQGTDMVLYKGLLHLAHEEGLKSIRTAIVQCPSELNGSTAIVHAEVETAKGVFEGIGDASPTNVTRLIVPHLIRMAETRAKARALRDALDIGFVAAEELGDDAHTPAPTRGPGVATTGAARVDADLRGGGSGAAPRPIRPAGPPADGSDPGAATPPQLAAIARLSAALGRVTPTEGLTRRTASDLISSLSGELPSRA